MQCLQQTANVSKTRQMCTGINNFLNTFYSAVVQKMFWGTCRRMLDEELLVWSPFPNLVCFLTSIFGQSTTILGMAGPVIWTINLSHTPLVSGWLWNTTMMLLKSDRAAGKEKQWGRVIICFFFFLMCPVSVYLHLCMEQEWLKFVCVRVCFFFFFLASMCIVDLLFQCGYYAFML